MSTLPNLAFHGLMGSGKSTVSNLLVEHLGYTRVSFAGDHPGGLRDLAIRVWGEEARNDRGKLQRLGMAVRAIDEDAFVNALVRYLETPRLTAADESLPPLVLDDLRFPNEAWALKGIGFTITRIVAGTATRIQRLKQTGKWQDESQLTHASELGLLKWPDDYKIINESKTYPELLAEVGRVVENESR